MSHPRNRDYRFVYYKKRSRWHWEFVDPDGDSVVVSEGFRRKRDCLESIELLQRHAEDTEEPKREA